MVDAVLKQQLLGLNGRNKFAFSELTSCKKIAQQFCSLGTWWLKCYVRVCSWGLDLQFYSTSTVNKEMCSIDTYIIRLHSMKK
jgi:hypothetical protein